MGKDWRIGDVVIHRADAKEPKMFMRVIGFQRVDGLCKTQYIDKSHPREVYVNDPDALCDPRDFGLREVFNQASFERVRYWNNRYPIGTLVDVHEDFPATKDTRTRTRTLASQVGMAGEDADQTMIWLEGLSGGYSLRCCTPVQESEYV